MNQHDYAETWHQLNQEKRELVDKRTNLETELTEINIRVSHLNEVLSHLAPLAGVPTGETLSELGITDAIRHVLENADNTTMSAGDVRKTLADKGFNWSGHTAPMSSVYKILSRLVEDDVIEKEKGEDGRVSYKWKNASGITDDDIPF